ncbi:hypothetical protein ON010_g13266 [Phytophthora cinnamomi]|nr:hypothetical protein ON010_g13266 [Phytophthora cinnamomi]
MTTPNAVHTVYIAAPEYEHLANIPLDPVALGDSVFFADATTLLFSELHTDDSDDFLLSPARVGDCDRLATSSAETEVPEDRNVLRAKEATKRRVYRRLQKIDREELRRLVGELSKELAQQERAKADERARFEASRSPAYLLWKSLAAQRQDERLLAEAQQQELTAAVGAQAVYINALEGILQKLQNQDTTTHISKKRRLD